MKCITKGAYVNIKTVGFADIVLIVETRNKLQSNWAGFDQSGVTVKANEQEADSAQLESKMKKPIMRYDVDATAWLPR